MGWRLDPPFEPGRVIFMASDQSLHSVPAEHLDDAKKIDPKLFVIAHNLEEWQAFQSLLDNRSQALSDAEWQLLAAVGISRKKSR
jgi:hypothetical protein